MAIIYGAGGIGFTVARAFAAAGAQVHLASRTQATLDSVPTDILARRRRGAHGRGRCP